MATGGSPSHVNYITNSGEDSQKFRKTKNHRKIKPSAKGTRIASRYSQEKIHSKKWTEQSGKLHQPQNSYVTAKSLHKSRRDNSASFSLSDSTINLKDLDSRQFSTSSLSRVDSLRLDPDYYYSALEVIPKPNYIDDEVQTVDAKLAKSNPKLRKSGTGAKENITTGDKTRQDIEDMMDLGLAWEVIDAAEKLVSLEERRHQRELTTIAEEESREVLFTTELSQGNNSKSQAEQQDVDLFKPTFKPIKSYSEGDATVPRNLTFNDHHVIAATSSQGESDQNYHHLGVRASNQISNAETDIQELVVVDSSISELFETSSCSYYSSELSNGELCTNSATNTSSATITTTTSTSLTTSLKSASSLLTSTLSEFLADDLSLSEP